MWWSILEFWRPLSWLFVSSIHEMMFWHQNLIESKLCPGQTNRKIMLKLGIRQNDTVINSPQVLTTRSHVTALWWPMKLFSAMIEFLIKIVSFFSMIASSSLFLPLYESNVAAEVKILCTNFAWYAALANYLDNFSHRRFWVANRKEPICILSNQR